jgi:4-hydroxy-tetrahydrodipicolinate synthase
VEGGAHGLFVLASQGEFFSLDRGERRRVARAAVRAARGRVPVVVNTGAISTADTLTLSHDAAHEGADALGLITPFYLKPDPQELFEHYHAVLRAVRCPVYAYNNPGRAGGVGLEPKTVIRLAKASSRFAGIFDATGDLRAARRYARLQRGRFGYFLAGRMELAEAMQAGARGAVLATGNAAPREFVAMYEAVLRGDLSQAERIRDRLGPLHALFRTGPFPGTMKACLDILGVRAGPPRLPALPASPKLQAKAAHVLRRLEISRKTGGG